MQHSNVFVFTFFWLFYSNASLAESKGYSRRGKFKSINSTDHDPLHSHYIYDDKPYEDWIKELRRDWEALIKGENEIRIRTREVEEQAETIKSSTIFSNETLLVEVLANITGEMAVLEAQTGKAICVFECEAVCSFVDYLEFIFSDRYGIDASKRNYNRTTIWSKILERFEDDTEQFLFPDMVYFYKEIRDHKILRAAPSDLQNIYGALNRFVRRSNWAIFPFLPTRPFIKKEIRPTFNVLLNANIWRIKKDEQNPPFRYLNMP